MLSDGTIHGDIQRTGVNGRDLASTYMLRPLTIALSVKCWNSNSIEDEGGHQGRKGVSSDGFLQRWTRGVSTLDLIVTEFQMGADRWTWLQLVCCAP